jgi:hypothetical protein
VRALQNSACDACTGGGHVREPHDACSYEIRRDRPDGDARAAHGKHLVIELERRPGSHAPVAWGVQCCRAGGPHMLLALAAIIAIAWLLGFTVFHVASGAIHILIVIAVIAAIVHFVQARRAPLP